MTFTGCMYYAHVNPRFMQNNQPITSSFLFASRFSKGAVKIISTYTQNYPTILYCMSLPCLVPWKQPHTRVQK